MKILRSIRLVTFRELRERGLSRSYLISWTVLMLLVIGGFTLPTLLDDEEEGRIYRVGVIGSESDKIVDAAVSLVSGAEPSVRIETRSFSQRSEAARAVAEGEIDAALVDGSELIVEDSGGSGLHRLLNEAASANRVDALLAAGEVSEEVVRSLTGQALDVTMSSTGTDQEADDRRFVIGQAAMVLLFMAIMMTGSWVLLGVTEEKASRVVEVLVSTIRPWQLLAGKILGVGILGLLQFGVVVSGVVLGIRLTFGADLIPEVDSGLLVTLLVWFILGYGVYGVAYAAVGAIASRPEDAQNAAFPMTMVSMIGYFVGVFYVGNHPDSTVSFILSLFPLTAPFVIPVRAVSDSMAVWEHLAAAVLMLGFTIWLMRMAGRVYAGGIFKYQSRVKLGDAFRSAEF